SSDKQIAASRAALGTRFEDHVERCLGCASEAREASLADHVADPLLAGLGSEARAYLLRTRCGGTHDPRGGIVNPPNRIEVRRHIVAGKGLHDHPGTILGESASHVPGGSGGI